MNSTHSASESALQQLWDRIGLGVRCAYNLQQPKVLHHYLQAGRRMSHLHPQREARIQRQMLELLLHTAEDAALPWCWRAACLEHAAWPLAHLTRLWHSKSHPVAQTPAQLQVRLQHAGLQLGLPCAAKP